MRGRFQKAVLVGAFVLFAAFVCDAHVATAQDATERSMEDLNLRGAAVTMPPLSDSLFGVDSGFRRAMYGQGLLLGRPAPAFQAPALSSTITAG